MSSFERFIQLSWKILEHKCLYYIFSTQIIVDYEYDLLEKQYESLAAELNLSSTASNMIDFDMNRPCCKRVFEKISRQRKCGVLNYNSDLIDKYIKEWDSKLGET